MRFLDSFSLLLLVLMGSGSVSAQFNIFEQMFGGGGQQQQQQQQQQPQDAPSDSSWYRQQHERAHCERYLCPDTLACVHFPHHCPCAWPANEDKFELAEGQHICISKGGFKEGEAARKVELARKGRL